jgi:hypothetical protein
MGTLIAPTAIGDKSGQLLRLASCVPFRQPNLCDIEPEAGNMRLLSIRATPKRKGCAVERSPSALQMVG